MNLELIMALNSLVQTVVALTTQLSTGKPPSAEELQALRDRARASEAALEAAIGRAPGANVSPGEG